MISKKDVKKQLNRLKVPVHLLGYTYIVEAVKLLDKCFNEGNVEYAKIESIYNEIAKKYGTSRSRVERSIRFLHERNKSEIAIFFDNYER